MVLISPGQGMTNLQLVQDSEVEQTFLPTKLQNSANSLPEEGVDIPSPSQQGICKELFKTSDEMEKHLTNSLCNQKWILCFDGHHIDRTEYQVVVIKNKTSEMKLAALKPCDGEAETITEGLISVLLGRISLVTFNLKDYR